MTKRSLLLNQIVCAANTNTHRNTELYVTQAEIRTHTVQIMTIQCDIQMS